MHDLKERLEPVKLSDVQKERILRNVKEGQVEAGRTPFKKGPFLASVVVGVAMLFLVFNLLTDPQTILQPGGSQAAEQSPVKSALTWKMIVWNFVASVLLLLSMIATRKAILQVKRWQSNANQKRLKPIFDNKGKFNLLNVVLLIVIWLGSYLCNWAMLYTEIWIVSYYVLAIMMFELLSTKDEGWSSCPHCGTPFTRKEMRKKATWQYREKCDTCEKPVFLKRNKSGRMMFLAYPSYLIYFAVFNFNLIVTVLMVAAIIWISYKYITPYSIQFSDEPQEEKFW